MKIKIKKLDERFKMPIKGDPDSACYDCFATSKEYDVLMYINDRLQNNN